MNAKEMFEELGYKRYVDYSELEFSYTTKLDKNITGYVVFSDEFKCVQTYAIKVNVKNKLGLWVTNKLHQAIHQQMKELGWIE